MNLFDQIVDEALRSRAELTSLRPVCARRREIRMNPAVWKPDGNQVNRAFRTGENLCQRNTRNTRRMGKREESATTFLPLFSFACFEFFVGITSCSAGCAVAVRTLCNGSEE